jgi:uncharacterized membrane protein HdeD (DUF308 family)
MAEGDARPKRPAHAEGTQWLLVVIGFLSAAAGVIVLAKPAIALATLAVITGIFLLVDGIIETVISLVGTGEWRGFLGVILGLASAIVGVLLIRHPLHGVVAVALLLGLWLIISAMVRFASALNAERSRGWSMAVALIELVAGVVIVSSPGIGVGTLALFVGISFILRGLALCAVGWLLPRFAGQLHAPPPSGAVPAS